jgi:hypothetical protein
MPTGIAELIRTDGQRSTFSRKLSIKEISQLIQADALDTVNLKDGHVMMVDDTGKIDGKPENPYATILYHRVRNTENRIYGDVVIIWDEDYA